MTLLERTSGKEESIFLARSSKMREIVHVQIGQCGNQIGAKVGHCFHYAAKR